MNKPVFRAYNVIDHSDLAEISFDGEPSDGDPVEIRGELYFVCEQSTDSQSIPRSLGVIPMVVRNPEKVVDIKKYIECLTIAKRRLEFRDDSGICDPEQCNKILIT